LIEFFTSHRQHLNSLGKKLISSEVAIVINDLFVKKQPTPIGVPGKGILDVADPNQNTPEDVTPNIGKEILEAADPNQNIPDNVTPNIGKEILDAAETNQNISDKMTPNREISKHLQNNDLE
jgi:hypothetical protein